MERSHVARIWGSEESQWKMNRELRWKLSLQLGQGDRERESREAGFNIGAENDERFSKNF